VFVELIDARGEAAGQAVYLDWRDRPLPDVGDIVCCRADSGASCGKTLRGQVRRRQFEVQLDGGETSVWVRLTLSVLPASAAPMQLAEPPRRAEFSKN
jgi:hypothetical protein